MEMDTLKVVVRQRTGKGPVGAVRREGFVPAVLYGLDKEPVNLRVGLRDMTQILHGDQGEHAIVELEIEGQPDLGGPAIFKEVQRHPVRGGVIHADLMRIDLTKKIETIVQTKLVGRSKGVIEGGVVDHQRREVKVLCLPTNVPEFFSVDISDLEIGDSLHVSDLVMPEDVELLTDPIRALVAVHAPRVIKTAEEEAAELAAAEGEEGEAGAEGAESGESDGGEKSGDN